MMAEITGIVQGINQKEDRFGVLLSDNNWYNDFGAAFYEKDNPIHKGDEVKIEYDAKGIFRNIKKIEKVGESLTKQAEQKAAKEFFPSASEYDNESKKINIRLEATKCASWIVAGLFKTGQAYTFEATVDLIKRYANAIENKVILDIENAGE